MQSIMLLVSTVVKVSLDLFDGNRDLRNPSSGFRDGLPATNCLSVRKVSHLMGNATAKNKVTEREGDS